MNKLKEFYNFKQESTDVIDNSDPENINQLHSNQSIQVNQYGQTVEDQVLSRDFKKRQVSMMAVASALGTGLIIGSGTALKRGGPASLFIGYIFTGSLLLVVLFDLGEMAAFSPMDKAISGYCARYCDKALGFAAGWNYFFTYCITLPAELSALGIVIQYWRQDLNPGIFITVFYVVITIINWFPVRIYGETEFWGSAVKLVTLLICFITCIVISAGGDPIHKTIGFQFWNEHAFMEYLSEGSTGRFLGWWACVVQSVFSYSGSECVGIVFGEAPDPKKVIPSATRQVFLRIGLVYILGVFLMGISVSPVNPLLAAASSSNASASPFVIAMKTAEIKVLPSFINACLLAFIGSAANSDVYLGSRTLYGLARDGMAPKIFLKLNRHGNPYYATCFTTIFGLLAYMNCKSASSTIFGYFSSAISVFGLLTWINIILSYITFYHATVYQQVPREEIPFRMWFQPYSSYFALFFLIIITFFNGYNAFMPAFNYKQFITCYIGIAVYLVMIFGYKLYYKTERVTKENAKLYNHIQTVITLDEEIPYIDSNLEDKEQRVSQLS
ncbi:hypothetical protein C6P40_001136 [Pichia californica]|uniref:Amino acid permease/ SLC12A domain-containing protein n=1 Tax=Pichia californica TaxID=460514 RepID=A0A9P6WK50_9ASCO|nr:hypothetical protein C6P40_001136 [[Candida] californica]